MLSRLGNWIDGKVEDFYFVLLVDLFFFSCMFFLSSCLWNWVDSEVEEFCFVSLVGPFFSGMFSFYSCLRSWADSEMENVYLVLLVDTFAFCLLVWETGLVVKYMILTLFCGWHFQISLYAALRQRKKLLISEKNCCEG